MRERIEQTLQEIESEQRVRILYAVESGSRAWGFASPDSDYDVRFLYVRSLADYLRIDPPRDVIELPITDTLDVNGWDIFKALKLLRASNPPLLEWLRSPIIYQEEGELAEDLRRIVAAQFSPRRMTYHYLSMARGNWKDYIAERSEVNLKKYLYVLRPLFCILWMERYVSPPPTALQETLDGIELATEVRTQLAELLEKKRSVGEIGQGTADAILNAFISEQLNRIAAQVNTLPDPPIHFDDLNAILWRQLHLTA